MNTDLLNINTTYLILLFAVLCSGISHQVSIIMGHVIFLPVLYIIVLYWLLRGQKTILTIHPITISIVLFVGYCCLHFSFVVAHKVDASSWFRYTSVFFGLLSFFLAMPGVIEQSYFKKFLQSIIVISAIIVIFILVHQFLAPRGRFGIFGLKEGGFYASRLYVPVTVILFGVWMLKINLFPKRIFSLLLFFHCMRLVIDLRKMPLISVAFGVICLLFFLTAIPFLKRKTKKIRLANAHKVRITFTIFFFVLIFGGLGVFFKYGDYFYYDLLYESSSGPQALLKGYAWRFREVQFEKYGGNRLTDYRAAIFNPEWNPLFGHGLGADLNLPFANRVHSLYVFLIAHLGLIGLVFFLMMILTVILTGLRTAIRTTDFKTYGWSMILTSAFLSYVSVFTVSVRGTDFEVMIILSILAGMIMNLAYSNRYLLIPEK